MPMEELKADRSTTESSAVEDNSGDTSADPPLGPAPPAEPGGCVSGVLIASGAAAAPLPRTATHGPGLAAPRRLA